MKSHHWNVVSGVLFLLVGLNTLSSGQPFEWYELMTIMTVLVASAMNFVVAWHAHRTASGKPKPSAHHRLPPEPDA